MPVHPLSMLGLFSFKTLRNGSLVKDMISMVSMYGTVIGIVLMATRLVLLLQFDLLKPIIYEFLRF